MASDMSEDYKVAFTQKALGDVPPEEIARIAVEMQTRLTAGGIDGLIEASSDVRFVENANARCLVCDGPLAPDRDHQAHPEMLRCYATPACTKQNLYILESSELGRSMLDHIDGINDVDHDSDFVEGLLFEEPNS